MTTCPGCGRECSPGKHMKKHTNRCVWLISFEQFTAFGNVDTSDPAACWPWRPDTNTHYGDYCGDKAHRQAYRVAHKIDPGQNDVCHRCDNPPCVNPSHLFLGTRSDNIKDAVAKGRVVSPMKNPAAVMKMAATQRKRYQTKKRKEVTE